MANRAESYYLGEIDRREKERQRQREQQRNKKIATLKKSDYVSDELFKTVRDGEGAIQSDDIPFATIVSKGTSSD